MDCTAHMSEVRGFDAQSLTGSHPNEWRSYQVLGPMMFVVIIEFRNFINVLI